MKSTSTPISWNMTASAPAASSRCVLCPRTRWWCSASSPPRAESLKSKDELKRRIEAAAKFVASRSALPFAAMRLRLHRGRKYPGRGRAMGEACQDRRGRARGLGVTDAQRTEDQTTEDRSRTKSSILSSDPPSSCHLKPEPPRMQRRSRRFAPTMWEACCARPPLKEAREKRAQGRDHRRASSRRSRIARSRPSSRSRKRSGCAPLPTASSAAHGGISISSGASMASSATSWTRASPLPACRRARKARASPASSASPAIP